MKEKLKNMQELKVEEVRVGILFARECYARSYVGDISNWVEIFLIGGKIIALWLGSGSTHSGLQFYGLPSSTNPFNNHWESIYFPSQFVVW